MSTNTFFLFGRKWFIFKYHFPECEVEDGERILHLSGKSYDIIMLEPFGIPTQLDLQFYIIKEYNKS